MPEPPKRAVDLAHDALVRAKKALDEIRELADDHAFTPEEAAEVLHGLTLPRGAAHRLAAVLASFGNWTADAYEATAIYEPLFHEATAISLAALRASHAATRIANLDYRMPEQAQRASAAQAKSPAALAAGAHPTLQSPGSHEPAPAALLPHPRIVEPPRR